MGRCGIGLGARSKIRIYSLTCAAVCITVRSCRSTSGPVISAGLNRTIPSLSTEQSGCPFHLTRIRPSSSSLASSSLRRSFCSTSCRNLSFCDVFSSHIQYTSILSALFERKKGCWSLVRENQQSSAHNFVKDFSLIFLKFSRRSPLKKGAATENPLEYGKTEVQILFRPLQAAISSMELPKNFENKKLPNPLR